MRTAAVIGANSMLGVQLTSRLAAMEVRTLSVGRHQDADIRLDLGKGFLSAIPDKTRADVVFHCASSFADDTHEGLRQNFQVNTAGCIWVLELAEHLESDSIIYAGSLSSLESLDINGCSSYGFTKGEAENILSWGMKRLGRRFCSLRFSQLYDTNGICIRHQPWFGRIIAYAANCLDINMPRSDGPRNFLHVADAVEMLISASDSTLTGVLDIVAPELYTYHEMGTLAYSLFGKGGQVFVDQNKTPFRRVNFPDGSQSFRALGHTPTISITDGIARIRDRNTWSAFGPLDVT